MTLVSVVTDHVRQDRLRRYEELVAAMAAKARKKKEAWRWTAQQVGFGPLSRIYYVSQHEDHADVEKHGDPQALFARVLGAKKGEKQLEESSACLVSSERALGAHRPDFSYPNERDAKIAPVTSLAMLRARPGQQDAVEELLRKVAEAIPKTGETARIAGFQALTGDMLVYWIVRPLQRLADLDQQSVGQDLLIKAFGQDEGERIFRSGVAGVESFQREILGYRKDLSNPPR